MRSIVSTILLFLLISVSSIKAQYYSSGADPSNVKWRQVKSEVFKVVYPEEFELEAKRFIAMLDSLHAYGGHTLKHTAKPIQVIIHSRSAYSNGFVSWAPKRIEIYPTPHQDMAAQDWLEQLAIHEFRHVVQIDKLNKGFTKALTIPFGQQAIGAVLGLYAPLWFLEGDATVSETTLSKSGRGRRPSFEQEVRAQVLEKKIYNYDKASFGSYKDYVPNHYHMGYLFTAGARFKYGADVWERALDEAGRKSWSITPFNRGVKQVTGKSKVPLYNEVYFDWEKRWTEQDKASAETNNNYITKRDKRYKNYYYPTPINNDCLIAEIRGPGELNHFVKINIKTGEEEKIHITGTRNKEPFSYNNNTLVWTELEQHPRWDNQFFSIIRSLDLLSGQQRKLTKNSRYKAPSLSPDGNTIAVINTSLSNNFSIDLISAHDGSLIKQMKTPQNAYPMTPSWSNSGDEIILILLNEKGKKIVMLDPIQGSWKDIFQADYTEIRFPKIINEHIYFTGSWSGIENIYRINLDGNELEKVGNSRFGAAYATQGNGNTLYYQDYTSDGYQIAKGQLSSLVISPFEKQELPLEPFITQLQSEEKGLPDLKNVSGQNYSSKKYSKWNLFNFHSWAPAFVNINDTEVSTGVSAISQNLLGTTFTSIGFNADKQYSREKYNFKFSYQAWWPVFDLELKMGNEKQKTDGYFSNQTDTFHLNINANPNHLRLDFDMKLPLNLSRGKYLRKLQPAIGLSYQQSDDYSYEQTYISIIDDKIIEKNKVTRQVNGIDVKSMDYSLFFYNLLRSTQRDVSSRFGQVIELSYRHTPIGGWDYGSILGVHTRLYLPGIGRHHAIKIDNDWHTKEKGEQDGVVGDYNYYRSFSDFAKFPRGINPFSNDELYSFKADYILPLMNPDFNIRGIMYLKRITTNVFFDYSKAKQQVQVTETGNWMTNTKRFKSFGTELRAEVHPFRFVFPISIGYRYAYIPETQQHYNEVLFSMGLAGIVVGK